MALRYEWTVYVDDFSAGFGVNVDDGTDSGNITTLTSGTYCHTDITGVLGGSLGTDWASWLQSAIRAVLTTANDATVTYNAGSHTYTLTFGSTTTVDFRDGTLTTVEGINLAKVLGFTANNASATGSGYDCQLSGSTSYTSDVRPYYLISPVIQGRSEVSDEYEPEGLTQDAESDDGTDYHSSRDGSCVYYDWVSTFENDDSPPTSNSDDGAPVFKRNAGTNVPWSYQHAWEHLRTGGSLPFLVVDGSDSEVHRMRAEGCSFVPRRSADKDVGLWSVPFKSRLLGTL